MENFLYEFMGVRMNIVEMLEVFPDFGICAIGVIAAITGDFLRTKEIISDTATVKWFTFFSHILPGAVILFIGLTYCNQTLALVLMFVGYCWSGCSYISCYRTIVDIAPNFAGTIYGLTHISHTALYVIIPKLQEYIIGINPGIIGWSIMFLIGGGCVIGTGIIYMFFAIAECQWWNLKREDRYKSFPYKKPEAQPPQESVDRQETPKPNEPPAGRISKLLEKIKNRRRADQRPKEPNNIHRVKIDEDPSTSATSKQLTASISSNLSPPTPTTSKQPNAPISNNLENFSPKRTKNYLDLSKIESKKSVEM